MSSEEFISDDGSIDDDMDDFDGDDDFDAGDEDFMDEENGDDDKYLILLKQDMAELDSLGYSTGFSSHSLELSVWVAMDMDFLTTEKAQTCGFYRDKKLACKIVFANPAQYLSGCPTVESKRITIRQTSDIELDKSKLNDAHTFGLWWTLEQRTSKHLRDIWNTIANKANVELAKINPRIEDDVQNLIGLGGVSRTVALLALEQSKNDADVAASIILDDSKKQKLISEAKKLGTGPRDGNLLMEIVNCMVDQIEICSKYCIVCGTPQPLELLKPTVCHEDLCNFQFVELGLGINIESDIMNAPEAIDLLICFTIAAAGGKHFGPFPTSVKAKIIENGTEKTLEFDKSKSTEVADVLQLLPSVKDLQNFITLGKLKSKLDKLHPLLYKLVRWVVGTNRAHLQKLEDHEKIPGITAETQFVMKSAGPATEKKFQLSKKESGGSFYAFHGSGISNWHSILRNGLKNYSNTEFMTTGAAYGPGIYMAVESGTSLSYAAGYGHGSTLIWKNTMFGASIACMALCEVVDYGKGVTPCLGKLHRPKCSHIPGAPYVRCEDESFVCTRFLFLFGANRSCNVNAHDLKVPNNLKLSFKDLKKSK